MREELEKKDFDMGSMEEVSKPEKIEDFGPNVKVLPSNDQIKELQTILRDKNTSRSDFKFYADRLIRLVIEESLNQLPFSKVSITTPTGCNYDGLKYEKGNCGVSIVRSGEAMEQVFIGDVANCQHHLNSD
ncbi:Hypothetical predicted protein [Cloeon dipterum]|uniref:Phosphoribosyltransferase domain-containing protein n=1 Tax=Cloeon dipterum TaxID=197152 RepID=A0A8S1CBS3_9INSE|nr:Hypothetical predicted protein [Cloeon dipterum]